MAIEAEKLIATFEARFSSLEKALAKARGDSNKTFGDITTAGSKAEATLARIGSRGMPGIDKLNRSLGVTRANTANVGAQFQDIFVQLQSGTSPFTVAVQQVNQMTAAMGQGGAGMALRTLGAGFMNLLSPMNLVGIALVTGVGYAFQYFTTLGKGTEETNKSLEEQAAIIQKVADRWGDAVPALKAYADELKRAKEEGDLQQATQVAIDKVFADARAEVARLNVDMVDLVARLESAGASVDDINKVQDAFSKLRAAVDAGKDSTAENKALSQALAEVYKTTSIPAVNDFWQAILKIADSFKQAADAAREFEIQQEKALRGPGFLEPGSGGLRRGRGRWVDLPDNAPAPGMLGVDDAGVFGGFRGSAKDFLRTRGVNEKIRSRIGELDDAFAEGLARLLSENPDLKIISAVRTTAEQAALYNDPRVGRAAKPGNSLHEIGLAADLNRSDAAIRARARQLGIEFPFPGDDPGHVQLIGARKRGGGGTAAGAGLHTDPLAAFREDPWAGLREKTTQQIGLNKELEESYGMVAEAGMNALHGIINALEDGKISTTEWLQIALTLIEQLSAIPAVGGKGGGKGGGVFGFLGQLLGGIFHDGGVVGSGGRSRRVPALAFAGAPRMHGGGIAGDEVPAILQRGEVVLPRGRAGGGGMNVRIGVAVDDDGGLRGYVKSVSRSTVRQAAPSIVGQARKAGRADFGSNAADWQMRER